MTQASSLTATGSTTHSSTIPGLVPDPPTSYSTLGYSVGLITTGEDGADYVRRICEGCGVSRRFEPRPAWKRLEPCKVCARMTTWRILV